MPDKAIDLLDEAAAHLRVDKGKTPPEVRKLQKELKLVNTGSKTPLTPKITKKPPNTKQRASQINDELKKLQPADKAPSA